MAKKKKCFVCGKDITHRSYQQAFDEETRKVVAVCSNACFYSVRRTGIKKPGDAFVQHKASK